MPTRLCSVICSFRTRFDSNAMGPFVFGALVELNDSDGAGNAIDERIEVAGT